VNAEMQRSCSCKRRNQIATLMRICAGQTLLWAIVGTVWAGSFPDILEDPLNVRPPAFDSGTVLPGDTAPVPCPATKDFAEPLALGEAVDLALCNNPQIKATWASVKVQVGALGEAKSAYLPTMTGTFSRFQNRTSYPELSVAPTTKYGNTVYANVSWRLFDFGGRDANRKAAGKLLDAALASHDAALQKILSYVIQAYFDAMTAKATLEAKTEDVRIAQATLEASRTRELKGATPRSDTLQAAAALARASLGRQRAQGEAMKALAVLIQVMGVPTHSSILLPGDMGSFPVSSVKDLDEWLEDAKHLHPAIIAAKAQWEAAQLKVNATRAEGMPTLDFSASYYQNGYPGQGLQSTQTQVGNIGLTLTVPFFEGFSRTYKIRGAQAQAEQRQAELQDTEHQVLTEVVKSYADAVSSLDNLQSSESLLLAAQAALDSSERRYAKGAADILELLNAQSVLADAHLERVRCLAEWHASRLELMANSGSLGLSALSNTAQR
jgi:outer membrane protein